MNTLDEKNNALQKRIKECGKVAVAFSGGIDSTLLLTLAREILGRDNTLAVIAKSQFFTNKEFEDAVKYCEAIDVQYKVLELDILAVDEIYANPSNRCYLCKKVIFENITKAAKQSGISTVFEGSNVDDLDDYRPGMQAVLELGVESPLLDTGFTKKDIRDLAHVLNISAWNKPSSPCLATRFVIGEKITQQRLSMVEYAERILRNLGFSEVRVRTHGTDENILARIEIGADDFSKLEDESLRATISSELKNLGYAYVAFDALGYRRGSMNAQA